MRFSLEKAQSLANSFRVDFNAHIDVDKDAPIWQESLADAGLTDEAALYRYQAFKKNWSHFKTPCLNDFTNFVRQATAQPEWHGPDADRERRTRSPESLAAMKACTGAMKRKLHMIGKEPDNGRQGDPREAVEDARSADGRREFAGGGTPAVGVGTHATERTRSQGDGEEPADVELAEAEDVPEGEIPF